MRGLTVHYVWLNLKLPIHMPFIRMVDDPRSKGNIGGGGATQYMGMGASASAYTSGMDT